MLSKLKTDKPKGQKPPTCDCEKKGAEEPSDNETILVRKLDRSR